MHHWHCRCLWEEGRWPLWKRSVASCTRCLRCCRMFCRCSCSCSSHCFCFSSRALTAAEHFTLIKSRRALFFFFEFFLERETWVRYSRYAVNIAINKLKLPLPAGFTEGNQPSQQQGQSSSDCCFEWEAFRYPKGVLLKYILYEHIIVNGSFTRCMHFYKEILKCTTSLHTLCTTT